MKNSNDTIRNRTNCATTCPFLCGSTSKYYHYGLTLRWHLEEPPGLILKALHFAYTVYFQASHNPQNKYHALKQNYPVSTGAAVNILCGKNLIFWKLSTYFNVGHKMVKTNFKEKHLRSVFDLQWKEQKIKFHTA